MITAVLSWLGDSKYQAEVVTDDPVVTGDAILLVQVYNTLYSPAKVTIGELAVIEFPPEVPYGPMLVGAVTPDGVITPRWTYCIHDGAEDSTVNFQAELRRRSLATHPMPNRVTGYRLRVDVVATRGLVDDAIFLFRQNRDDRCEVEGDPNALSDEFMCVCHPGDLEEYPVGAPAEDGVFFRKKYLDVVLDNSAKLEEMWLDLRNDVDRLMFTLECNARMNNEELVVCDGRH